MNNNESVEKIKAENEALWKINKQSEEEIHELRTELLKRQSLEESFCKTTKQFDKRLEKTVKLERAEAIKELAERLKKYRTIDNLSLDGKEFVYIEDVENLVKEMTK